MALRSEINRVVNDYCEKLKALNAPKKINKPFLKENHTRDDIIDYAIKYKEYEDSNALCDYETLHNKYLAKREEFLREYLENLFNLYDEFKYNFAQKKEIYDYCENNAHEGDDIYDIACSFDYLISVFNKVNLLGRNL